MQKESAVLAGLSHGNPSPEDGVDAQSPNDTSESPKRDYRFWAIIIALCTMSLLSAAENTVVITSLPTIVEKLNVGRDYVWITNVFFLTRCVDPYC